MKQAFWKSDRFVGIVISLVFLVAWRMGGGVLGSLERNVYDLGVQISNRDPEAHAKIAVVAIDDTSIQNIGRWPWSREIHANMIKKLAAAGAKAIGSTVLYSEPSVDPGLKYIDRIGTTLKDAKLDAQVGGELQKIIQEAKATLDTDAILADAMKQGSKTVLGMQFTEGSPLGNPDAPLPDYVQRFVIPKEKIIADPSGNGPEVLSTSKVDPPIPALGQQAAGIGHLINPLDVDGGVRFEPLVIRYYDSYFPSLSLMIAARSLNVGVDDIKVNLGDSVELKGLKIKTDAGSNMNTYFYGKRKGDRPPFDVYSFYDVLQDTIPADNFKDRIVLLGATAFGVGTSMHTPVGNAGGPVLVLAHTVASILNQDFFVQPGWAPFAEFLVFLLVAGYLVGVLPKLRAGAGAIISASTLIILIAIELILMKSQAMWLQLVTAAALLAVGHVLLTTKRFLVTEASKLRLDVDSATSNKQLALQFQQQGQLDMAFDYFRKCPVDESLLEAVYGLAADFEAKRKFNKAAAVYQYIAEKNPTFRDIKDKVNRAKQLEETVLLGGAGPKAGATMLLDGSISKPMLGRYEVEKELGKGAMGIVYLGKDPKINRVVAIKTMALSQEFEADELDEVKARFFREAETAGRLVHPNIVTIYDAGEEHDLAYIAMEFLEGHDLVRYTKPDTLLPLPITMGIVFKAAMALDYAHKQNVVHRDIKPANIMYEPNKKAVKLTDFGIARITDSSRTKTGMVLGTPSYMSPEQLSGKKVDGRSDLFSLGVMLYQMVTGKLPFVGESMATLMYKIANEPHMDIGQIRPELAKQKPCLSAIIDKALQKDVTLRYQTGADLARDIQACAKQVAAK
ncbi:MAG: CHASE2 domain-containing protein [Gammaproteobacteria bacterium]|nr:CHASE2 domain-containing protein [Gammaproteobacteria bacterium]MBI5615373.1 CHASE2 domain-containing protein [Gammaproteobacteria bacterium]